MQTTGTCAACGQRQPVGAEGNGSPQSDFSPIGRELLDLPAYKGEELQISPMPVAFNAKKLRANVVRMAEEEWHRWGKGSVRESDSRIRNVLKDYWVAGANAPRIPRLANWWSQYPWSAAFISWVMRKAGAGDHFRYSSKHAHYIKHAKSNDRIKAFRITEIRPEAGDVVCRERASSGVNFDNVNNQHSHCDIVTGVDGNKLTLVGGNACNQVGTRGCDTVGKKILELGPGGFLRPGRAGQRYFAILRVMDQNGEEAWCQARYLACLPSLRT